MRAGDTISFTGPEDRFLPRLLAFLRGQPRPNVVKDYVVHIGPKGRVELTPVEFGE
jgi:hypothetical protein